MSLERSIALIVGFVSCIWTGSALWHQDLYEPNEMIRMAEVGVLYGGALFLAMMLTDELK